MGPTTGPRRRQIRPPASRALPPNSGGASRQPSGARLILRGETTDLLPRDQPIATVRPGTWPANGQHQRTQAVGHRPDDHLPRSEALASPSSRRHDSRARTCSHNTTLSSARQRTPLTFTSLDSPKPPLTSTGGEQPGMFALDNGEVRDADADGCRSAADQKQPSAHSDPPRHSQGTLKRVVGVGAEYRGAMEAGATRGVVWHLLVANLVHLGLADSVRRRPGPAMA